MEGQGVTLSYAIAFGGPVLVGLIGLAITELMRPRARRATPPGDSVASQLAEIEDAARHVTNDIAAIRARLTASGR